MKRRTRWIVEGVVWTVAIPVMTVGALVLVFGLAAYAYEGDDGGLDQSEVAAIVERYAERGQQMQLTEPPKPPAPAQPVGFPGDCASWRQVFAWYGATPLEVEFFFGNARPWGVSRTNIIWGESGCGLRFKNPDTGDTGICQLNPVHRSWVSNQYGLRVGKSVSESEASNPAYVRPCLHLLRNGTTPNSFDGACNWRAPNFCA